MFTDLTWISELIFGTTKFKTLYAVPVQQISQVQEVTTIC